MMKRIFGREVMAALLLLLLGTGSLPAFTNGENASYVLGAPNFTSMGSGCFQNGTSSLNDVAYDSVNSRLFVADSYCARILAFNVAAGFLSNGENASYVLGQAGFTTGGRNFIGSATPVQNGMSHPTGVAYDSINARLFVSDTLNNRVLVFNVAPGTITNGEKASYVLGQSTWSTNNSGKTSSTLNHPAGRPRLRPGLREALRER